MEVEIHIYNTAHPAAVLYKCSSTRYLLITPAYLYIRVITKFTYIFITVLLKTCVGQRLVPKPCFIQFSYLPTDFTSLGVLKGLAASLTENGPERIVDKAFAMFKPP